jgi:hypothetical protein
MDIRHARGKALPHLPVTCMARRPASLVTSFRHAKQ